MNADRATGALLSIGEVSSATGIQAHVLRYWEGRLPQLNPVKRAGGRRYYRAADVALIRDVQQLIDGEGFTLDGAARALQRGGGPGDGSMPRSADAGHPAHSVDVIRLKAIRDRLARALN